MPLHAQAQCWINTRHGMGASADNEAEPVGQKRAEHNAQVGGSSIRFSLRGDIEHMITAARAQGLAVGTFVTFAAPVPPWQAPPLSTPQVIQRQWQPSAGDVPSTSFRASFAFPRMPMASLSALARLESGTWHSCQDPLPVVVPERRASALFGREADSNARQLELGISPRTQEQAGLLAARS